ncbi:hypothetical protein QAD02_024171 [Eretmocerus hayati]|uniref:Uncharacterized protein n=1 Tax=Eretmocerus hayati TaxID=131215 RepID=A0ACC2Q053_9HYME|nr:hypothetical protein QAD02_024171 [Eretmocerus hayati]
MHIAASPKTSYCTDGECLRENSSSDFKEDSVREYYVKNPRPSRILTRYGQPRARTRQNHGHHQRSDHTYAAVTDSNIVVFPNKYSSEQQDRQSSSNRSTSWESIPIQDEKTNIKTDPRCYSSISDRVCELESCEGIIIDLVEHEIEDTDAKTSWLCNLRLEYQPDIRNPKLQTEEDAHSCTSRSTQSQFWEPNDGLRQCHRKLKGNTRKSKTASSLLDNSEVTKQVQENKNRWIAALALMELAQPR